MDNRSAPHQQLVRRCDQPLEQPRHIYPKNMNPSVSSTDSISCSNHSIILNKAEEKVKEFYFQHTEIKASHGWKHIDLVLEHTQKALLSLVPPLPSKIRMEVQLAALLHDVDDRKYFPGTNHGEYPNADSILSQVGISEVENRDSHAQIIKMISWVSCSENGNKVPAEVEENDTYYLLIARWADRLCAVGEKGVVRCYQYNQEFNLPLSSEDSPRPLNEEELWTKYAIPSKFEDYINRGGTSKDMISHYYDKLLHIAKPPNEIVKNPYLEQQAEAASEALVEVCLRYGKTGEVDEEYIKKLMIEDL